MISRSRLNYLSPLACLVLLLLLAGCTSDDAEPFSTAPPTPSGTVFVLDHPTPSPTVEATPAPEVRQTVWLVNLRKGTKHTLYEHPERGTGARFVAPRTALITQSVGTGAFNEDGLAISMSIPKCEAVEGLSGVTVWGVEYPEIPRCGLISPDGRHMLFEVPIENEAFPSHYEQWVLDLESGERLLLQGDLVECGGCDSRFGSQWFHDGRYVVFAETRQEGRVFLADAETGATRVIAEGSLLRYRPAWSPADDPLLLVRREDDATALLHAVTGEETLLPIEWPAVFEASGSLVYSSEGPGEDGPDSTSILDLATSEVTEIQGRAPWSFFWWSDVAVAATVDGFVAALESPECDGTLLHVTGMPSRCIGDARGAVPSPNGTLVAFSRHVPGDVRSVDGRNYSRYDIAVLDVASGEIEVVAEGAYSGPLPPRIQWNPTGDLFLVSWPHFAGL